MALENLKYDYKYSDGSYDCDFYIAQLVDEVSAWRVGDAWFAAFTPIFDVENGLLGLGLNARGMPGNTVENINPELDPPTLAEPATFFKPSQA